MNNLSYFNIFLWDKYAGITKKENMNIYFYSEAQHTGQKGTNKASSTLWNSCLVKKTTPLLPKRLSHSTKSNTKDSFQGEISLTYKGLATESQ